MTSLELAQIFTARSSVQQYDDRGQWDVKMQRRLD